MKADKGFTHLRQTRTSARLTAALAADILRAMRYKPDGYTDLAPYLVVPDAEAVLAFCEAVFGATSLRVIPRPDKGIMHAECRIGDTVLMMGEAEGPAAMLNIYVPDADEAFDRAVAFGAEVIQPMTERGDGDRRGGLRSADGTQWYIARQVDAA